MKTSYSLKVMSGREFAVRQIAFAERLHAVGCSHLETGFIRGAVHYVMEDQQEEVAQLIERYASRTSGSRELLG
jgi:hypothetical protein